MQLNVIFYVKNVNTISRFRVYYEIGNNSEEKK